MQTPAWHEQPITFDCEGSRLVGIVTQPAQASETGVVIVVGGPQYRAGSHRQFTLLARQLATQGIASFRFDYRGMGDSEGDIRNFEAVEADIHAAINTFLNHAPEIHHIVIWGLCDAASAALYYAPTDPRVSGLILLNPWVHTEASASRIRLKHYYWARLMQLSFWVKLLSGKVELGNSVGELTKSTRAAGAGHAPSLPADPRHGSAGYIDRMIDGLKRFQGEVLFILSGNDLTAQEFIALIKNNRNWRNACRSTRIELKMFEDANHTFSSQTWRRDVGQKTADWVARLST